MSSAREQTVLPLRDTDFLDAAQSILATDSEVTLVGAGHDSVVVPDELRNVLAKIVTAMRRGQAVTFAPLGQRLTTQQAADLLGVSRPTLIKLLETGRIPFETPGRHRRIRLSDLLDYQAVRRDDQRRVLQELTQDAQDLGLYDDGPDAYDAALSESRAKRA
jgi:excisionase family DNA binding protein